MRNPFAFLKFRIYRRTFYTYCVIMLLLIGSVSGAMLFNARAMGLAQFVSEADSDYSMLETKRQNVLSRIDRLFFRIYASRSLETDFSGFFGASPEEYMRSRLDSGEPDAETYLDALSSLAAETGCCIRYVLHDTGTTVTAAEFSANGYSRYHVLSAEAADFVGSSGFVPAHLLRGLLPGRRGQPRPGGCGDAELLYHRRTGSGSCPGQRGTEPDSSEAVRLPGKLSEGQLE